ESHRPGLAAVEQELEGAGRRELGRAPKAAVRAVEARLQTRDRLLEDRLVKRLLRLLHLADRAERLTDPGRCLAKRLTLGAVGARRGLEHLPEARHPLTRLRREVGAAVERHALGVEEDGQRPS